MKTRNANTDLSASICEALSFAMRGYKWGSVDSYILASVRHLLLTVIPYACTEGWKISQLKQLVVHVKVVVAVEQVVLLFTQVAVSLVPPFGFFTVIRLAGFQGIAYISGHLCFAAESQVYDTRFDTRLSIFG